MTGRRKAALAAGLVGVSGFMLTMGAGPSAPPSQAPAGTANLWIDEDGGTCVRQASPAAYNTTTACDTIQEAADSASSGDTILIRDGSYEGMELNTGTDTLTFEAAGPGRPSFGQLIIAASNVSFEGIEIVTRDRPSWTQCPYWDYTLYICGDNTTWTDVVVNGNQQGKPAGESLRLGGIQLTGSSHHLQDVEVYDVWDNKGFQGGGDDLLVEDSYFHDVALTAQGQADDVHLECAAVTEGNNQIWRRNKFWHCGQINWVAQNYVGGPAFGPVILEGNVFAHPIVSVASPTWQDGAPCLTIVSGNNNTNDVTGWIVRYNTFECDLNLGTSTAADEDDGLWYGNLGVDPGCSDADEWVVSYNVGSVCNSATGNVVVANALNTSAAPTQSPFYVDEANNNFALAGGANSAVNIGSAPNVPGTDIDGNSRPFGASVDAGAYERQS